MRTKKSEALSDYKLSYLLSYAELPNMLMFPLHSVRNGVCSCGCADVQCKVRGKHPRITNWPEHATNNPAVLHTWWTMWPDASIGAIMGLQVRTVVVDQDGPEGEKFIESMGGLPCTVTALTGNGKHYYFKHPGGHIVNRSRFGPGVDMRSDGGYVVLPPSPHFSGAAYQWSPGLDPWHCKMAELPAWVLEALNPRPGKPTDKLILPSEKLVVEQESKSDGVYWLGCALARVIPGNRNHVGFWLACQLRDSGMCEADAYTWMMEYVAQVPMFEHPYTQNEAERTLRAVFRQVPRGPAKKVEGK